MMKCKKLGAAALAGFCSLALALAAHAQQERNVTTNKAKADTVKVNVSGAIVLDWVYRDKVLSDYVDNFYYASTTDPESGAQNSNTTFEGYVAIRLDVELSDKVSAVVELGTRRVSDSSIKSWNGTDTYDGDYAVNIREAHVVLGELFMPELKAQLGISTWNFDVRGKGSAFAFDPRHSQSFTRNNLLGQGSVGAIETFADDPDELSPVGAVLTYSRDAITLDLVLLPMIDEGGASDRDEALYAIDFWYSLDAAGMKNSKIGVILAAVSFGNVTGFNHGEHDATVMTFGVGATLKDIGTPGLELYAEVYSQSGDAGQQSATVTRDAKGMALQLGLEYRFNDPMNSWLGLNYTSFSGDSDTVADDTVDRFMSYENVSDLAIIEDMYFGMDIDSNYTAVKISAGTSLSVGAGKNNLELSIMIGLVEAAEPLTTPGPTVDEDALGTEIDLKMTWHLGKQASIKATFAMLSGSDVVQENTLGSPFEDDSMMLFSLGMDVKF